MCAHKNLGLYHPRWVLDVEVGEETGRGVGRKISVENLPQSHFTCIVFSLLGVFNKLPTRDFPLLTTFIIHTKGSVSYGLKEASLSPPKFWTP